jgi:hypothetical protein
MGPVAGSCFKRKVYITGYCEWDVFGTQKNLLFRPIRARSNVEFTMVFIRFLYGVAGVQLASV